MNREEKKRREISMDQYENDTLILRHGVLYITT